MNMGWQHARRVMKEWGIFWGLFLLLLLLVSLGFVILEQLRIRSAEPIILLMVVYVVSLVVLMVFSYRRMKRADSPPEYREAREQGVPATAKVLDIETTDWRNRLRASLELTWRKDKPFALSARQHRLEYQMRLRVTRPGEADYEAQLAEYLTGDQVPEKGAIIPVKVHPQRPEIVVLSRDEPA